MTNDTTKSARQARYRATHRAELAANQAAYRSGNTRYSDSEQRRNSERHHKEWALGEQHAVMVAIDGEADDTGRYWLLQAYDGTAFYTLESPTQRLTLTQAAYAMRSVRTELKKKHGKAAHFYFFSMNYDIDQLIGGDTTISNEQKARLVTHRSRAYGAVRGPDFREDEILTRSRLAVYNGRKDIRIRYLKSDLQTTYSELHFRDVWSLSAQSFVATIERFVAQWTDDEREYLAPHFERVKTGKLARGDWQAAGYTPELVKEYNESELILLQWYMTQLVHLCEAVGLSPRSFAGPAPLARALLMKYGVASHIKPRDYDTVDYQEGPINDACRAAFYGGRIELAGQGTAVGIFNYDIRSAYPSALAQLPCLAHGAWRPLTDDDKHALYNGHAPAYAIWRIRWRMPDSDMWGPFPYRQSDGAICYPLAGEGWYHTPEVQAFYNVNVRRGDVAEWQFLDGWVWEPDCTERRPFESMVHETYQIRADLKAAGNPAELVLKLALNSQYGVMAQTSGSHRQIDKDGATIGYHTPRFSNLYGAGLITSMIRAKLYHAIMSAPSAVICAMTDGLYTLAQLPLEQSNELGEWELSVSYEAHLFVTPGVVFKQGGTSKTRGIPVKVSFSDVYETWRAGEIEWSAPVKRYQGLAQALRRGALDKRWGTFIDEDYTLSLSPLAIAHKRDVLAGGTHIQWDNEQTDFTWYPPWRYRRSISQRYERPMDSGTLPIVERERDAYAGTTEGD